LNFIFTVGYKINNLSTKKSMDFFPKKIEFTLAQAWFYTRSFFGECIFYWFPCRRKLPNSLGLRRSFRLLYCEILRLKRFNVVKIRSKFYQYAQKYRTLSKQKLYFENDEVPKETISACRDYLAILFIVGMY